MRLRLTAHAIARGQPTLPDFGEATDALTRWTADLVSWYDRLAINLAGDEADDRVTFERALPSVPSLFDPKVKCSDPGSGHVDRRTPTRPAPSPGGHDRSSARAVSTAPPTTVALTRPTPGSGIRGHRSDALAEGPLSEGFG
jgi:hypothetical protein